MIGRRRDKLVIGPEDKTRLLKGRPRVKGLVTTTDVVYIISHPFVTNTQLSYDFIIKPLHPRSKMK